MNLQYFNFLYRDCYFPALLCPWLQSIFLLSKKKRTTPLLWLWTFLKNILIFLWWVCICVCVHFRPCMWQFIAHNNLKKTMDIGRQRAGSKFKFLFFSLLGQRKGIMLNTADGDSWKGSKWTSLENRSKWCDLIVSLGAANIPGGSQKEYAGETHFFLHSKVTTSTW